MAREELKARLAFRKKALAAAYDGYYAVLDGRVLTVTIGSRGYTKLDIDKLWSAIEKLEGEVDKLEDSINGKPRRKAMSVIVRDW